MLVDKIEDLKFKKGEEFSNEHISIKNDAMYVTIEVAKTIKGKFGQFTYRTTKRTSNPSITLYFGNVKWRNDDKNFKLCGCTGDFGFGEWPYTDKWELGVRVKRESIEKMINLYLQTPLARKEKLKKLLKNVRDKS